MNLLKRIKLSEYKELFGYTVSKITPAFAVLCLLIIIIKVDSYETYGKFAIVFSFANMMYFFLSGWINQSQLRFLSSYKNDGNINSYLSVISTSLFIIVIISLPINYLILNLIYDKISYYMYLAIFISAAMMLYYYSINIFQSLFIVNRFMRSEIIRSALYLFTPVSFILIFGNGINKIVIGVCLSFIIMVVYNYLHIIKKFRLRIPSFNTVIIKKHLIYSWPITIWLGLSMMYQFVDRYIIEHFFSLADVGLYSSYFDLSTRALSLVYYPIIAWMFPRLTEYYNLKNKEKLFKIYNKSFKIFSLYTLLLLTFLSISYFCLSNYINRFANIDIRLIIPFIIGGINWQFALLMQKPFEVQKRTIIMMLIIFLVVGISETINLLISINHSIYSFAIVYAFSGILYNLLCLPNVINFFKKKEIVK